MTGKKSYKSRKIKGIEKIPQRNERNKRVMDGDEIERESRGGADKI